MPDMDSTVTQDEMMERFGTETDAMSEPSGSVLIQAPEGKTLEDPEVAGDVDKLLGELKDTGVLTDTDTLVSPVMAAAGMQQQMSEKMAAQGMPQEQIDKNLQQLSPLSADKRTGTVSVTFDSENVMDIPDEDLTAVTDVLKDFDGEGSNLTVKYSGNAFNGAAEGMNGSAEIIGLIVAAVVLLITFGSFVAAGMPLLSAVIGVGVGLLGVQLATLFTDTISDMTPMLLSLIHI